MPAWDQTDEFWESEDPDAVWDAEAEDEVVQPRRKSTMITLKTSLARLGREEQHAKMKTASDGLKANATLYPTPPVATADRETRLAAAKQRIDRIAALELEIQQERELADQSLDTCRHDYEQGANYVVGVAQDDPAKAIPSGYELADAPGGPGVPLTRPENLEVEGGDEDGEAEARVRRVPGAGAYEWQWSESATGPYQHIATTTKRSASLKPLPSTKKVWLRVRGVRGDEHGSWSDPACVLVP